MTNLTEELDNLTHSDTTKAELLEQYRKAHSELTAQVKQYVDAYSSAFGAYERQELTFYLANPNDCEISVSIIRGGLNVSNEMLKIS